MMTLTEKPDESSSSEWEDRVLLEAQRRRKATENLLDFTKYTFEGFEENWHHALICRRLDQLVTGEIKRLMIFAPPRHSKSEFASRRLPAYYLGRFPNAEIIACSYASTLASRMNRDVQRIIDSPAYHRLFPNTRLWGKNVRTVAFGTYLRNSDLFEVVNYRGAYRSAGVQAGITGQGFELGIIDDPFADASEAASPTIRENVWEWFVSTFLTRKARDARILVMQTRWHQMDLAGRLLKLAEEDTRSDQWTVVSLPAVYEPGHLPDDPRQLGEALWPSRFPLEELQKQQVASPYYWAAMYQQRPTVRQGGFFERQWFGEPIDRLPANQTWKFIRAWDMAATEAKKGTDPDWTVGVLMARSMTDARVYVMDVRRMRGNPGEVEELVRKTADMDGKSVEILIEQEPGSSGVGQIDRYRRFVLPGFIFYGVKATGPKELRAEAFSSYARAGYVRLLKGAWIGPYLETLENFPQGAHDDDVDASSLAFAKLTSRAMSSGPPVFPAGSQGVSLPPGPAAAPGPQQPGQPAPAYQAGGNQRGGSRGTGGRPIFGGGGVSGGPFGPGGPFWGGGIT